MHTVVVENGVARATEAARETHTKENTTMNTTLSALMEPVLTPSVGAASLVTAGQGRFLDLGDHRAWVKVSAEQTGGEFLLAELEADFQGGVPPHIHRREDEA